MKVLVLDNTSPKAVAILEQAGIEAVVNNDKMDEAQLCAIIGDYDGVIVRSASKITAPIIEAAPNLKIIGRAGVGVDNIDVAAATAKGIPVVNAPDGNTIAVAEQTFALMLGLARHLPQAHKDLVEGNWNKKQYTGVEVRGKVLGIIGLGRIGNAVAKRAQAFDMKTIGYDPMVTAEAAAENGIEYKPFEEVLKEADFLSLHVPKTKDTADLFNKDTFALMKEGARIINVARGGVVNEADLCEAIKSGKIAGAAVDVFSVEPMTESEMFTLKQIVVAPHLGASTKEAQVNVALDVAEEFVNVLAKGEMAKNAVNLPKVKPEVMAVVKPFLNLAEKLGKLQAQLTTGAIENIKVTYSGELAKLENVAPLTTAVVKGLLEALVDDSVNMLNAPTLAKERGLKIEESKKAEAGDYVSLITVEVKSQCPKSVAGTLFGVDDARIVSIDGYRVDAIPEGNMLVIPHVDKPRIIGKIGNLIGAEDINIAGMQVGRKQVGGKAIMLLAVDAQIPDAAIAEIGKVDGVLDVRQVSL